MESAVEIASALLDGIVAAAAQSPDREVCGLLFGSATQIDLVQPCTNVADEPAVRFEIDPAALITAYRAMRGGGPMLIGHYHSHPTGVAEPSACDAAAANGEGTLWLIIGSGKARLWRVRQGGAWRECFEPVPLCVTAPCAPGPASP
ncbi:M67 family metallopeptidase [Sphingomonas sp. 28-62-11]|uniref:M67 family metallopeptidase n=1 Tax=Sphingomonas sp. 28-62-11 TaxID=1970432 RepID=UPI000BD7FCB9|nr:MAG: hypothetical protein B7Y49_12905 [Sphingomonas sp. 28-62-11]